MPRRLLLIASLALSPLRPASGQTILQPDSATLARSAAHAALTYWEATSGGPDMQSVYLKNNSTRPILITSYEVFECFNIPHRVCGVHTPGPVIAPGQTLILVTINRVRHDAAWSYRYHYSAEFLPDSSSAAPTSP